MCLLVRMLLDTRLGALETSERGSKVLRRNDPQERGKFLSLRAVC